MQIADPQLLSRCYFKTSTLVSQVIRIIYGMFCRTYASPTSERSFISSGIYVNALQIYQARGDATRYKYPFRLWPLIRFSTWTRVWGVLIVARIRSSGCSFWTLLRYPSVRDILSLWRPKFVCKPPASEITLWWDHITIVRVEWLESDVLYGYKTVQLTLYSISSSIMRDAAENDICRGNKHLHGDVFSSL